MVPDSFRNEVDGWANGDPVIVAARVPGIGGEHLDLRQENENFSRVTPGRPPHAGRRAAVFSGAGVQSDPR
jgi:hypothetical protein